MTFIVRAVSQAVFVIRSAAAEAERRITEPKKTARFMFQKVKYLFLPYERTKLCGSL